ncbi:MAG: type I methionyl aminopeptidase [Candidatus Omnitrophica bacterium]|nr:type I methionyl aminopeptidase [Candidatus Omnitrophota bacterium]
MIEVKSSDEIERIRIAGRIARKALDALCNNAKIGRSTAELDRIAEDLILKENGTPAFKGYKGFPNATCTSVNESVVHEIPSKRILINGDIVSFDVGVGYKGLYADAAITVGIGRISEESRRLIDVTENSLYAGIDTARAEKRISDISHAIQSVVESKGFSVVRVFVGHGIGRKLHEEPEIPNFGEPNRGPRIREGMLFAIEPMVNVGGSDVKILDDGWTAVTRDGSRSAHFEHTIVVTSGKPEILTQ